MLMGRMWPFIEKLRNHGSVLLGEWDQANSKILVVSSALATGSMAPAEATARVTVAAGCCQFFTAGLWTQGTV